MSLLMQALRKAERAKHGSQISAPHEENGLQLEPLETDVQKAAASSESAVVGGPAFSLEPLEPPTSTSGADDDEDIPVVAATEAMHDPVPPQARPGARRNPAAAARAAAAARLASDMPHGPGQPGGLGADPVPHARSADDDAYGDAAFAASMQGVDTARTARGGTETSRPAPASNVASSGPGASPTARGAPTTAARDTGATRASGQGGARGDSGATAMSGPGAAPWSRTGAATRASANASRQRLTVLAGLLVLVLLAFGFMYWKAVSSPGPGASLPPVPMPAPGAITGPAQNVAPPVAGIPGVDTAQPIPAGTIPGGIAATGAQGPAAVPAAGSPPGSVATSGAAGLPGAGVAATTGAAGTTAAGIGANGASAAAGNTGATAHGVPAVAPAAPGAGTAAARATVPAGAITVDTASPQRAGHTAATSHGAAPATRPQPHVIVPTAEALAAIPDPAMREEARRDAEERAARLARDTGTMVPSHDTGTAAAAAPTAATGITTAGGKAGSAAAVDSAPASAAPVAYGDSGDVRIVRNNHTPQVSPALQNAYSAFKANDMAAARQQYDAALAQDANNRDALLGSAAVAVRQGNGQLAAANYVRLLELDPGDPEALAGLVALRPGDIGQAESRLKAILQRAPESGPVLFTLGNLYARQGRWPEAQQSYFRAYSATPDNPDYAFNLAIGLDRLNQGRLAKDYYQRALTLAQTTPAGFDPNAVRKRLLELGAPAP